MLLSVGLYAPLITTDLVFSEQYKIGTLKNEISYGIPRSRIYLGKLVLEIAVAVLACALAVGLYLALCVPTLPLEADPDGMLSSFGMPGRVYCCAEQGMVRVMTAPLSFPMAMRMAPLL